MISPKEKLLKLHTAPSNENTPVSPLDQSRELLVIDDDPMFRSRIARVAKKKGLSVTLCGSLEELSQITDRNKFDVVLMDYYLDEKLVGSSVAQIMGATPVVMMSSLPDEAMDENDAWPDTIRTFVSKQTGISNLLGTALSYCPNK